MRTDLFDFALPESSIALRPVEPRDGARLLVVDPQGEPSLHNAAVRDLPALLRPGDALVLNDTRVIAAALDGVRLRGDLSARVSVNLLKRTAADRWIALARPARRLRPGDRVRFGVSGTVACMAGELNATVVARGAAGETEFAFDLSGDHLDAAIAATGTMPLPPYIALKRAPDASDAQSYQTVFASRDGAVAAPTAGLHFTAELLSELSARGVSQQTVTLHVGAGTFLPVKVADTDAHIMHAEWGDITHDTAAALNAVRAAGGRIVACGTTALRVLESSASPEGRIEAWRGETSIFITPGYRFRAVDALLTNFHLPRSTLFMLVSAFSGLETMQKAYAHAIESGYRFYSYGDASLLFPDHRASAR